MDNSTAQEEGEGKRVTSQFRKRGRGNGWSSEGGGGEKGDITAKKEREGKRVTPQLRKRGRGKGWSSEGGGGERGDITAQKEVPEGGGGSAMEFHLQ